MSDKNETGITENSGAGGSHWQEFQSNRRRGDRYIRINRLPFDPTVAKIERSNNTQVVTWDGQTKPDLWQNFKSFLIGKPIATAQSEGERLNKLQGLAVLSSDALSSVAYATEAALFILVTGFERDKPTQFIVPISVVICILTAIVAWSYRQTIFAYPNGGGSYIVAKDNFGTTVGLFAAAALMIDYILNVAVSVSSGTANFVSAFPALQPYALWIMLGLIAVLMLGNLRGVRESGTLFAIPVYFFIVSFLVMIGTGLFQIFFTNHPVIPTTEVNRTVAGYNLQAVSIILILQAFASGCTAMTGVEAISNGVPAFKKPESKNAATTLLWMAGILIVFFLGISFLADQFHAQPTKDNVDTVISQLSRVIFGNASVGYYVVQAATTLILVFSANTSFADFPRLASLLSRDKFLPHIFAFRGDRLAFTTGIVVLSSSAALILVILNGNLQALIPLFAVGVFLAFTLSQAGMVVHWQKQKRIGGVTAKDTTRNQFINGLGAVCTGLALAVITFSKFAEGAWIVVLLIPALFFVFRAIHQHYQEVASQLALEKDSSKIADTFTLDRHQPFEIIMPVNELNLVCVSTLKFAHTLNDKVTAVFVSDEPATIASFKSKWEATFPSVPLVILETRYRSVIKPLVAYLEQMHERHLDETLVVVLPEFVVRHWWEQILHNQTALRLKTVLLKKPGIVVLDVPYQLR